MKKIILILFLCFVILGCSYNKKPELTPTQIVGGKSIVIPPEFDVLPQIEQESENKG